VAGRKPLRAEIPASLAKVGCVVWMIPEGGEGIFASPTFRVTVGLVQGPGVSGTGPASLSGPGGYGSWPWAWCDSHGKVIDAESSTHRWLPFGTTIKLPKASSHADSRVAGNQRPFGTSWRTGQNRTGGEGRRELRRAIAGVGRR